jgi:hypothetical protein
MDSAVKGIDSPAPGSSVPDLAELVLVFASTTEVLNAEDRLEAGDFDFALIPVPKEVNPNCGLALSFTEKIFPDIDRALAEAGLEPIAIYRRQGGEFNLLTAGTGFPSAAPEAAPRPF